MDITNMYIQIHNNLIIRPYNNTPSNNSTTQQLNTSTPFQIRSTIIIVCMALIACQAAWCNQGFPVCDNPREVVIMVLLQGYYQAENDKMQRTQHLFNGTITDLYEAPVAEKILVELRHKNDYNTLVAAGWVSLHEEGTAAFDLSAELQDKYHIVIKTRNHLETVSALPVCFSGTATVSYEFTSSDTKAYGNNLAPLGNNRYGLFAGDVNQDGSVDINDLSATIDQVRQGATGYLPEDINGDGSIDINDLSPVIDNVRKGIGVVAPP